MSKTILFAPLNTPGHINASVAIADVLKDKYKYRTCFLLLGDPFGLTIRDHGHNLVQIDEVCPYEEVDDKGNKVTYSGCSKWPQLLMKCQRFNNLEPVEAFIKSIPLLEDIMIRDIVTSHNLHVKALEDIKPDLIVFDGYFVPPSIINYGCLWVRLHSANPLSLVLSKLPNGATPPPMCGYSLKTKQERDRLRREEPDNWQRLMIQWKSSSDRLEKALGNASKPLEQFYPNRDPDTYKNSPFINFYLYPKYLDYDQDDDIIEYPPRFVRCESLIRMACGNNQYWSDQLESKKTPDIEAIVFFSLGTLASGNVDLMKKFVNVFKQDKKRLYVISKGMNGHNLELDGSNMIGDNYVPQMFLLNKVNLAIVHGGNNTVTECLHFGVPMIVVPCFADQLDNAQRIEDLGLGKRLGLDVSADKLLETVDSLLSNQKIIEHSKEVSSRMQNLNECDRVCSMLNKLALSGQITEEELKR